MGGEGLSKGGKETFFFSTDRTIGWVVGSASSWGARLSAYIVVEVSRCVDKRSDEESEVDSIEGG